MLTDKPKLVFSDTTGKVTKPTIDFYHVGNNGTKKLKADPLQQYYAAKYAVGYAPGIRENDGIKRCPICSAKVRYAGAITCPDCK